MWCLVHIGAQSMICFQFSSILIKFLGLLLKLQQIWMTCWLSRQVSLLRLFSNHNVIFTRSFFTSSDGRGVPRASIGGSSFPPVSSSSLFLLLLSPILLPLYHSLLKIVIFLRGGGGHAPTPMLDPLLSPGTWPDLVSGHWILIWISISQD